MLKLSKMFFSMLIIYILWFKEALGDYPVILYGTFIAGFGCTFIDMIFHRDIKISGIPCMYIVFGIYSLISGVFIAKNFEWFLSSMMTYFAFALSCLCIYYISNKCDSFDWILNCLTISAIICAVYTLVAGVDYKTEVIVHTMSAENNPHTLGFMMVLGIYSIISNEKKMKKRFWINLMFIALFLIIILLCGSRKCLIAACFLMMIWVINVLKTERGITNKKISIYLGLLSIIVIGVYYVKTYYMNSTSFERLLMLENSSYAADNRWKLYLEAFDFWNQSPIFGKGFGQFQILSKTGLYSHSSYAEILSCAGTIGLLIFFIPFFKMLGGMIKEVFMYKGKAGKYDIVLCLAMMLIEVFLGVGQIYIYDFGHMIILMYLYAKLKKIHSEQFKGNSFVRD